MEKWSAHAIASRLRGRRTGRYWKCKCPAHDDRTPSLLVWEADGRAAFWCASGCDWRDVRDALSEIGVPTHDERPRQLPNRRLEDEQRNIDLAQTIWDESDAARDTPAEQYLARRGLVLPPDMDHRLVRFHPRCPRADQRLPAMVIALRDAISNRLVGISRTFIGPDFRRIGDKMTLGRAAVAKLSVTPEKRLNACEGFETGLALWLTGRRPMWSFGSAYKLANCPLIDGVDELIGWLDNDVSRAGERAGFALYWRWHYAGREVSLRMPRMIGTDFADVGVA